MAFNDEGTLSKMLWMLGKLNCQFIKIQPDGNFDDTQSFTVPESCIDLQKENPQAFKALRKFLIAGKHRISLFQWLLESFEKGITKPGKSSEIEVILQAFFQLGITNRTSSLQKSIEGLNGMRDSVQILYRLVEFVFTDKVVLHQDQNESQVSQALSDSLLSHICQDYEGMFQTEAKLFPPGFIQTVQRDEEESSFDSLTRIVAELERKIDEVRREMEKADEEEKVNPLGNRQLASEKEISEFGRVCEELRNGIFDLNFRFETGLKKELRRVSQLEMQRKKETEEIMQLGVTCEEALPQKAALKKKMGLVNKVSQEVSQLSLKLKNLEDKRTQLGISGH